MSEIDEQVKYVLCPFCGEDDFDLVGLKYHLMVGYCAVFNETISAEEEAALGEAT